MREGEEDFEVQTPDAALSQVGDVLTGVQVFIAMIASISILVGAIGIVNTMRSSVLERKSQIGIMKAIGATNHDVFMQFFIESGLMGLIGGLAGVTIGTLVGFTGTIGINAWVGSSVQPGITPPHTEQNSGPSGSRPESVRRSDRSPVSSYTAPP